VSAPVFFLDTAEAAALMTGDTCRLTGDEGHHAADVRRLRAGEAIDLTDGAGQLLHASVSAVRRGEVELMIAERVDETEPSPRFTVVQALARGGRDEQAVEAMTEVGVDAVVGWESSRVVARWTDRTLHRWTSVSRAAARQARRAWWPQISGPATTDDVAERCRAATLAIVLHEGASTPLTAVEIPTAGVAVAGPVSDIVVVVGPEGGITDAELAVLTAAGAHVVRLGPTVLRSSTAGVAALAVLSAATRWR
jgi:16S rRNA (uracil1498-N3)-methyltransferase